MKWRCNRCRTIHRSNPDRCTQCGNTVLSPDQPPKKRASYRGAKRTELALALGLLAVCAVVAIMVF